MRHRASARRASSFSAARAQWWLASTSAMARTCASMPGDEDQVRDLVERVAAIMAGIDIFFANAGISGGWATISEQTAEDWAEILRVNLIGPFLAIKYAAPIIQLRGGGSIICTASVAGLRSGAGGAAYSASKAGVINLVQTAAQQLSGSGIRVNAICPGLIETGMTKSMYDAARGRGKERPDRRDQPVEAGRRTRRDCSSRIVPGVRPVQLRQWHSARRRRRPVEQPSRGAGIQAEDV